MNVSADFESEGEDDREEPEDPRLAALVEALVDGKEINWQEAESSAGSAEQRERIRSLAAISEVATFHRTWLAEGGILGDLDEDEEADEEVPTHWGELEILERVGRGSFGDVYKAREPRLDRIVALKLIRASARTPERETETLREGRLLAKVRHPNVATVHGAAGADGRVGFWMEFLEGKNLAEILAEKVRFEAREAAEIGIALCRALGAVHAQGIVHRDVKAQNVVRENDGRIVLTDFGVGRDTALLETEEPSLSGTPLYLAPELFEGKPPSPASDLYALGVLLFYLVTGEFPVTGSSFEELRIAHRERKRRWLKELRRDLPGTFVAAVERALDRDPQKRVGTEGMEKELRLFLGASAKVRRLKGALVAAAIIAVVTVAGVLLYFKQRESRHKQVLAVATQYIEEKDFSEAIRILEVARSEDSSFVQALGPLATARAAARKAALDETAKFVAKEDLWSAIHLLETATTDDPGFVEGLQELTIVRDRQYKLVLSAEDKIAQENLEAAIRILEDATKKDPKFVEAWRQLGLRRQTLGDHVGSMTAYLKASTLCAGDDSLICLNASTYYELACLRYEKAVSLFERVVDASPSDVDSWRQIAMLYSNLVQPERGIPAARQAGTLKPMDPVAAGLLPLVLAQASNLGALDVVSEIRRRLPSAGYLYWPEGIAEMVRGREEEAFRAFGRLERDPKFASIGEIHKAQIRLVEKRFTSAEALLENGLSVDRGNSPRDVELRQILLSVTAQAKGNNLEARHHLETLFIVGPGGLKPVPGNLKLLRAAGIAAVRANALDLADRFSKQVSDLAMLFPSNISESIDAQLKGEIYAANGKPEEAKLAFDQALEVRNDPFLKASRLRLLISQGDCEKALILAGEVTSRPGLIYADYFVPWIEIREATDRAKTCTPNRFFPPTRKNSSTPVSPDRTERQ